MTRLRPRYFQTFKYRLWRLFGQKVRDGFREALLAREAVRQKRWNSTRIMRALWDLYSDAIQSSLVYAKNPFLEMISKPESFHGSHIRVPV